MPISKSAKKTHKSSQTKRAYNLRRIRKVKSVVKDIDKLFIEAESKIVQDLKADNLKLLKSLDKAKNKKADMIEVFKDVKNFKFLDYISCWFLKASQYISNSKAKCAFVSTNSICQGNQVDMLWPNILKNEVEIFFAYPDFKWENNAKNRAQVICSIIGLQNKSIEFKKLFKNGLMQNVKNINPYLVNGSNII